MATANPITLPLKYTVNQHALPAVKKFFTGGNNVSKTKCAKLYNSGAGELHGDKVLPTSLDNSMAITMVAIVSSPVAGAVGEKVRLEVGYHTTDTVAGETADPAAQQQTVAQSVDVSGWGAKGKRRVTFTLTAANFAAEDHLEYYLKRDPAHVDDNHAQDLNIHALYLKASY